MAYEATDYTDLHSHLVPGVDDGARTVEEALEGLGRMVARGYRKIVTTPHLDASLTLEPSRFGRRMEEVSAAWRRISREATERWPELDFRRGFEVMLDVPDADFSDRRLRLAETGFVLVEWPRMRVPPRSTEVLSRLRFAGLRPIVAHPERYFGVDRALRVVSDWREAGAFLQVNNGSLAGRYGPAARTVALRLLKRGWVEYFASDFHGRPHLSLYSEEVERKMADMGAHEHFTLLAATNPARVLRDEEPLPVPPLQAEPGLWERIRDFFTAEEA